MNSKLRDIILNTRVPLVLKDFRTNWECFDGSLAEWCIRYDKDASSLPAFEVMEVADCATPQWERKRKQKKLTMQQFLQNCTESGQEENEHSKWAAYQYVRAHEVSESCIKGIDFNLFGFTEHQKDFSLWLGSQNANTPCHYDTYGVNIVVQIYGNKSWLLFPPETSLQTTRIPYEESSVYCLENFYAPALDKLSHYEKFKEQAYNCVLCPGDVLIVPRHWWHYVEAENTSFSVNYWVPLKTDLDYTLDELLVKHIIESFVKGESDQLKRYLLNPNQLDEIVEKSSLLFSQFEKAVLSQSAESKRTLWDTEYLNESEVHQLITNVEVCIQPVEMMSNNAYMELLTKNSRRHRLHKVNRETSNEESIISSTLELLINSMCAPHCIAAIKRELFRRLSQSQSL